LKPTDHAYDRPDHTGLRTSLDLSRRDVLEEAAKACGVGEGAEGPSGPAHRTRLNRRNAGKTRSISHEKLRGEVVGAFDHEVLTRQQIHRRTRNESASYSAQTNSG
jgi:hypothetical protein